MPNLARVPTIVTVMAFAFASALALAPRVIAAQPASKGTATADTLFEDGRKLLTDGKNAEACAKFDQAIKLDPDAAGVMLNLGLCNENLKKFKTALYWFRRAQVRATETKLPEAERVAREHTTDLATKVATVNLDVGASPPAGTRIRIDGEEIQPADYARAEVDPGHHELDAGAPGMRNVHQPFDVEGTGGQAIAIKFVAGDNAIVIDRGRTRRRIGLISMIGGGAALAATAVVAKRALDDYNKYKVNAASADPAIAGPASKKVKDAQDLAKYWGTSLFAIGAAGLGIGAYVYLTAPQQERRDPAVWVPVIGPDQVGFAVSGGF